MRADNNFIFFGKIVKAHGTKGEVVIAPGQTDFADPVQETLYIKNYAGDFVPHKVEQAVLRKKSSRYSFFVKFARIDSRTKSEQAIGSEVYSFDDTVIMPEEITEAASLTGCYVFDEYGNSVGKVIDEMYTQAHPLIEISLGKESLLLPFVDEYIVDHNSKEKKVIVKNLDRFIE